MNSDKKYSISGIILIAFSCIIGLSILSYTHQDLPFMVSHPNDIPQNYINYLGAYIGFGFFFLLGWGAYLVPLLLIFWAIDLLAIRKFVKTYVNIISLIVLFISFSTLCSIFVYSSEAFVVFQRGGILGVIFSDILLKYLGYVGSIIIGITLIVLSLLLSTEMLLIPFLVSALKYVLIGLKYFCIYFLIILKKIFTFRWLRIFFRKKEPYSSYRNSNVFESKLQRKTSGGQKDLKSDKDILGKRHIEKPTLIHSYLDKKKTDNKKKITYSKNRIKQGYELPPLDLLRVIENSKSGMNKQDFKRNIEILEETLSDFGIKAKVVHVEHGPVVTLYELEPAAGVKIQKIANLSSDIALVMKAHDVRVVAPIPGKGTVGVEIPNLESKLVSLKELLISKEFRKSESKLTLAVGKDVAGKVIVSDLAEMPHLLIAGATGSGKTVCVNSIIMSILFNVTPEEVKFILVDPKMVELSAFNDIPHLLCPIVTSHKKVSGVLNWIVDEMEERYKLFAKVGARDIDRYNRKVKEGINVKDDKEETVYEHLPYIVLIIDELADLMSIASNEIEEAITRLAQLSRAVGIHMILATQRPSVDVITGTIKANFPARISFKVASKVDSRTVLDANGADKLLGKGDMLFLKPQVSKLIRTQGALVTDEEVERVVSFVKNQRNANYNSEILEQQEKKMTKRGWKEDELYENAVKVVLETGHASASMIQRRLRVGYTRAARLIDMMEDEGIVGGHRGSKARKILVESEEELNNTKDIS